jgi:transposase InsO family protein
MDLITGLPKSEGHDTILTIVDHGCSRAAIFLPCSATITSTSIAQLYLEHLFHWFGLPQKIISDRDPRFTSHFTRELTKGLGINQNLSTAFHPQIDGLSEQKTNGSNNICTLSPPTRTNGASGYQWQPQFTTIVETPPLASLQMNYWSDGNRHYQWSNARNQRTRQQKNTYPICDITD